MKRTCSNCFFHKALFVTRGECLRVKLENGYYKSVFPSDTCDEWVMCLSKEDLVEMYLKKEIRK